MNTAAVISNQKEKPSNGPVNTAQAIQPSPAVTASEKNGSPNLPKTRGEWFYDALQQIGGKGTILASTAALGFLARYGQRWYGSVPNPFRIFNDWLGKTLVSNPLYTIPKGEKYEIWHRLAGAVGSTMLLFHGGNLFSPVQKTLENHRENIANWYNRRWGKPGDVEIAHERLKDEPQQTWGDVVKGRLAAWLTCFGILVTGDLVIGKGTLFGRGRADKYRFDQYEEGFGRWLAGFTKKGKELWNIPLTKELTEAQKQNKVYQFGKITALDFYVTNIAIIIWSFFSRRSAKKRQDMERTLVSDNGNDHSGVNITQPAMNSSAAAECTSCRLKSFVGSHPPSEGYVQAAANEKTRASDTPLGIHS